MIDFHRDICVIHQPVPILFLTHSLAQCLLILCVLHLFINPLSLITSSSSVKMNKVYQMKIFFSGLHFSSKFFKETSFPLLAPCSGLLQRKCLFRCQHDYIFVAKSLYVLQRLVRICWQEALCRCIHAFCVKEWGKAIYFSRMLQTHYRPCLFSVNRCQRKASFTMTRASGYMASPKSKAWH